VNNGAQRSPHRAWIEVDHGALLTNLARVREIAGPGKQVIGVVKANAYGHGDVAVAKSLVAAGVERLAVATLGEGLRLRDAGIDVPLLLLWGVGAAEAGPAIAANLEPIVYDERGLGILAEAAHTAGRPVSVHLKVDTGLGRQGSEPSSALELAVAIARSSELRLAGTMSHLAVPGEDDAYTDVQTVRLAQVLDGMRSAGIDPGLVHVSGSGGLLAGIGRFADAVRPGLVLYGLLPTWAAAEDHGLRPILSLRALPLRLFELAPGEPVGYGLRFRAQRRTRIATLGIGYGDGWPRIHANNGSVLVRGSRAPIVGAVSMDGLTVDIGEIDGVTYADEFVLIGEQGSDRITADEVAAERRTINYEVTTALRERLPRIHLGAEVPPRPSASES
jgi:alanine racemase